MPAGLQSTRPSHAPPSAPVEASSLDDARRHHLKWQVLLATMFCYLFYYTGRQSFGFAIPGMQQDLGLSKGELGAISAALLWSYAIGQAVNGNLADKFGGRRMVALGAFGSCALNWLVSFAQGWTSLFAAWGANGFAQSMGWAPGSRVLANWWSHEERGRAYGYYVFAAGMSSVLTYALAHAVLDAGLGWRWIFRLPVLLMLCGGAAYYILVRDKPSDVGLQPVAESTPTSIDTATIGVPADAEETTWQRYRAVLRDWRFLAACVAIGFQSLARYGLLIWVPVYFLSKDATDAEDVASGGGKWISLALPIGMALGALASGKLSDVWFRERRWCLISSSLAAAAVMSLGMYFLPRGHTAGIVVLFLCGFFAYGPQSAFWALCPDLLGTHRAGTGTGVMNTFAYAVAGLGEPLIGHLIEESTAGTVLVFPIIAVACLIGAAVAPLIRR